MDAFAMWSRPVWFRARTGLARRFGAAMALAAVLGVAAGVVVAAVAGARRTDAAVGRFVSYFRTEDVYVGAPDAPTARRVAQLPQVADATNVISLSLNASPDGSDSRLTPYAAVDDHAYRSMLRPFVLRGRLPRPDDPFDAAVSERTAQQRSLHLGSSLTLYAYSAAQVTGAMSSGQAVSGRPDGPSFTVRVVGTVKVPQDITPSIDQDVPYALREVVDLSPAFLSTYASALGIAVDDVPFVFGIKVRLRHGLADLDAFSAAARPLLGDQGFLVPGSDAASTQETAQRTVHLEALGLLVFAAIAAIATALTVGQMIAREAALQAADDATMHTLGMTRGQAVAAAILRAAVPGAVAAAVSVGLAVALSPLFPIGFGRRAEIDPGVAVDVPVLLLGALATLAFLLGRAAFATRRAGRRVGHQQPADGRPSVAEVLSRAGVPPAAATGVQMSVRRGHGPGAVPVRTATAAAVSAVAAVVAALTFGVSLDHLLADHRNQGWNWDVLVGEPEAADDPARSQPLLTGNPLVEAAAAITTLQSVSVGGDPVETFAMSDVKGTVSPTVLEGRAPAADDEIALASATLHRVHGRIGGTVAVEANDRRAVMRIVGRIVMPTAGGNLATRMNKGAVMTMAGGHRLFDEVIPFNVYAVRYGPGVDPATGFARLQSDFGRVVLRAVPSEEVRDLARIDRLPEILAGLMIVAGAAAIGHALVTSIRRRRRDLAVLKTLGFVRRQVGVSVACQAGTLAILGLLFGLPLGLAAGRWGWVAVAYGLGIAPRPVVPVLGIVLAVPVTLLLAILLAAGPGWTAARIRPAVVLRTE